MTVAALHEQLYPELAVKSANLALGRLAKVFNDAAEDARISVRLLVSSANKAGAKGRWVWFEGAAGTPDPVTPELDRIEPGTLVEDARAIPIEARPVVVLFTYNEHETAAVLRIFTRGSTPQTESRDGITYNHLGIHGGHLVVHRVSEQGQAASQTAAEDADREWAPAAMLSVGIAFGQSREKQEIGDVLVATAVYDYEKTKRSPGGAVEPRGLTYPVSDVLAHRIRHLDQTKRADPAALLAWPRLHTGVVLSGSKLIDDTDFKTELARLMPGTVGGEMEGLGLAHVGRRRGFDWVLVKAICDWGDGTKNNPRKDEDQRVAADNAAVVVFEVLASGPLWPARNGPAAATPELARRLLPSAPHQFSKVDEIADRILNVRGMPVWMEKHSATSRLDRSLLSAGTHTPAGVDVLDTLLQWVDSDERQPIFALLGEYGMGKTISCQRLAVRLQQRHRADFRYRPGLYFDLRSVTGLDRRVPTLDEILVECMSRDWPRMDGADAFTAAHVFSWLDAGAVIIFDGLDEALVKMSGRDGQTFTRTLLGIADIARNRQEYLTPRVLISCRTPYFRTLRDQQNHFTGYERRNPGPREFRAVTLLPLTHKQILGYLHTAVPGQDPERLVDMLRSVHNLTELAQRPFTLALIADSIPQLEAARAAGRPVFGVSLYRSMAATWLDRDEGKHHIRPDDKLLLSEHLAAHLWRNRVTTLPATDLENWFHQWGRDTPAVIARYTAMPIEQLEEDLRTATFLARVDGGAAPGFRFAHTSLLEFFLAEFLLRAVIADAPDRWIGPTPSDETFGFLAQSMAERDDGPQLLARLTIWGRVRRVNVNENILAAALAAGRQDLIGPSLRGIDLTGANVSDRVIDGRDGKTWLNLSGAKLSGVVARRTMFVEIDIQGTNFEDADLAQTQFLNCRGSARWLRAKTGGAKWRENPSSITPTPTRSTDRPGWATPRSSEFTSEPLLWSSGHTGWVQAFGFSPDGALLATAGAGDGAVRLWNTETGDLTRELTGHAGLVRAVGFSPDGTLLATAGGGDRALRLWNPGTGDMVRELTGHTGSVQAFGFSPDGTLLATAGIDRTVRLWEPGTGDLILELTGHTGEVEGVGFSPDGGLIATASDGKVRLWDPRTGDLIRKLTDHAGWVRAVGFSPDGTLLATAGIDRTVRLWEPGTGDLILELTGHTGEVEGVGFSPNGGLIATASDGKVRLWDPRTGDLIRKLTDHAGWVRAVGFSPDGTLLATAGIDRTVRLWEPGTGDLILELTGHAGEVEGVGFSPNGGLIATASDGKVRLWDPRTGDLIRKLTDHAGWVRAVGFSPDGTLLATAGIDRTVRLWEPGTGDLILELTGHTGEVTAVVFSPDGSLLAGAGMGGTIPLWDPRTGDLIRKLSAHAYWVQAVVFSPDGSLLAGAGMDGTVRLWNPGTGDLLLELTGHGGWGEAVDFSPDGDLLATTSDDTVRLYNPRTGALIRELTCHTGLVKAVEFSPDGELLAGAGMDGVVRLWNPWTGELIRELTCHTASVLAVEFSPDGDLFATTSDDGTLRIWQTLTGAPVVVFGFVRPDSLGISGSAAWNPSTSQLHYADGTYWRVLHTYRTGLAAQLRLTPLDLAPDGPIPGSREVVFPSSRSRG